MIDIAKARALCEAATPGPWKAPTDVQMVRVRDNDRVIAECFSHLRELSECQANADFIAAARTLLPEALDEIEDLCRHLAAAASLAGALNDAESENARLRRALDAAGIVLGSDE